MAERTIGAGFIGKAPGAFVSKTTQQSHRGLTLFMSGIGLIVVLTAKNSNGETYVAAAVKWIRNATTGTVTPQAQTQQQPSKTNQQVTDPNKNPLGGAGAFSSVAMNALCGNPVTRAVMAVQCDAWDTAKANLDKAQGGNQ